MKILLRIILGVLIIFVIIVLIGLFLPSEIHVERSMAIKAPQKLLFEQVNNLHNWRDWSPWHRLDPKMKIVYSGPLEGTGASYSWNSKNKDVGNGKITILYSKPYDSLSTEMDFMQKRVARGYYIFKELDSITLVTWGFKTDLGKNPFARYFGLMMDKYVGGDFEKGLNNLDSIAGNLSPYIVKVKELNGFNYVSIRQNCSWENVSSLMADSYGKLMTYIKRSGARMTDSPYAIYHNMDEGMMDLEMGIPVDRILVAKGSILSGSYKASPVAEVDYYGFYDKLGEAHNALQDWVIKMNLELNGSPMEQYVTDPSLEPDTSKWLTRIYYPVKR